MRRSKKSISLIYLTCAAITWVVLRQLAGTIWAIAHLPQMVGWVVPPTDIISAVLALSVFLILMKNQKVNTFTHEVITELAEVSWPKRKETLLSTGIVSILVGIAAGILFGFDMFWGMIVQLFYK
ncbi:MAG: preprotein translocase subunit SecE [Pseudomonadota bacterium]